MKISTLGKELTSKFISSFHYLAGKFICSFLKTDTDMGCLHAVYLCFELTLADFFAGQVFFLFYHFGSFQFRLHQMPIL